MKTCQAGVFQYIKMPTEEKRLFCLQQNISAFAWMVLFIKDSLTPIKHNELKTSRVKLVAKQMRSYLGLVKRNVRFLGLFIGYKIHFFKKEVVVELPFYGQLCVPVHKGYKIFDVYREVVIKVFDHDVDTSVIREEIQLLKLVSGLEFAPSIKEWNLEEGWYKEEYLTGLLDASYTPMDSSRVLQKFSHEILQPLIRIMLFQKPIGKNSTEYVRDIVRNVPMPAATGTEFEKIFSYIDSILNGLRVEGNGVMMLVFSHGDFVPANMLNRPDGIKIIDWEGAGYRSAMFDFYSYFFYRSGSRNISIPVLIEEVQKALPLFIAEVKKKDPVVARSLISMEKIYRRTFYIEMICRFIQRKITDKNLDIFYYTQRYIKAFLSYDEMLSGKKE